MAEGEEGCDKKYGAVDGCIDGRIEGGGGQVLGRSFIMQQFLSLLVFCFVFS